MKYKSEIMVNQKIVKEFVFDNLSHPKQAVRNSVQMVKDRLSHFVILVANDYGEVWSYVARKSMNRMEVRPMKKYDVILSRDDIDMIFTGNASISGVI